ncbi:MAG: T9SS type A sorting domain-containing protein [Taibaiella sp.]|nr:T9SS type A sorting domain-containing protein [Taibaiella sp.]
MKLKFLLTATLLAGTLASNAQTVTRLIASERDTGGITGTFWVHCDSLQYVYSGAHTGLEVNTGTLSYNNWTYQGKYDSATYIRWLGTSVALLKPNYITRTSASYDGSTNLTAAITQNYDTGAKTWNNAYRYAYAYDAGNRITKSVYSVWAASTWIDSNRSGYTYDASGNVLTDTFTNFNNGNRGYLYTYTYDTHNNITMYVYQTYSTSSSSYKNNTQVKYYLNAGFKPDSTITYGYFGTTWYYSSEDLYKYDGSYHTIADTFKRRNMSGTAWVNNTYHTYTYAGSVLLLDSSRSWSGMTSTWVNYYAYAYAYNSTGLQTRTDINKYTSGSTIPWSPLGRDTASYNADGTISYYATGTWNAGSGSGGFYESAINDSRNKYYYQTITVNTPNVAKTTGLIKVYPCPGSNLVNIDLTWDNAESATISIYDMSGRVWSQWKANTGTASHNSLSVSQYPAGNYLIRVAGEHGDLTKLFTVAH